MIVGMRTRKQAARVAAATGGMHLPGKPKPDGTPTLSRYVDVGADFEAHRAAVESVSVLFDLYDGDANCYAQTGSPGEPLPTGWTVTAAKFEVDWPTDPDRAGLVRSHFGARRKAFNWGLAQVKADLDAKAVDPAMSRWAGIWGRCARCGTAPSIRWRRGGPKTPRRPIRVGWQIWRGRWRTGRPARTANGKVAVWVSRGSNLRAATPAGCGLVPEPCVSRTIGAR